MTLIDAAKQALEALQEAVYKAGWIGMSPEGADEIQREVDEYVTHRLEPAITALNAAIEQAEEQEGRAQSNWDNIPQAFNDWWNADYDDSTNPFRLNSPAYWAWSGWSAANKENT